MNGYLECLVVILFCTQAIASRITARQGNNTKHHLMIGTWTQPGAIFTVSFDEQNTTLELVKRTEIPENEPISWMTFDHANKNLYGAALKKWGSYTVQSPSEISHDASLPMAGDPKVNDPNNTVRAIFILAANKEPYNVYAAPYGGNASGFLNVFSVNEHGGMHENIQNPELDQDSGVHGMVFDAEEEYLYSADLYGNKIWCHKKDMQTGLLTLVGSVDAPNPDEGPRWVEMHPQGAYLYVLMEESYRLCVYVIDQATHLPVYTQISYPLIPPGLEAFYPPKTYRSDVVFLSSSNRYLFASTRGIAPVDGYIAAFEIGPQGEIKRQICLFATPTGGGFSNAISPSPWTDEWLALTDHEEGWVEIYRWHDEFLGRVAHLDVDAPGFGMNAIWYD